MKIGVSTFVMQGGQSGVGIYIRELIRQLQTEDSENRYDLLMAQNEADLIPVSAPNFNRQLYPGFLNQPLVNLAWHNVGLPQKKYDLLHIPSYRRIPLLKRTRIVATVHDLAAFSVHAKYDRARMLFNRRIVPAMIRRADHVIAVSQYTKNDLIRLTGYPEEKISVIYSGIDHGLFRELPNDEARREMAERHGIEKPFFAYVARLEHPAKNHIRLIQAFERFKLENDSAHQLALAGADWHGAEIIRTRAAESPVKDDILFPGFVPSSSLPFLYNACDLMVFPSLFEGFGFPIIEALACGAKVVCSNTSSMAEIARDLIPTFDPTSTSDIFRAMETAISAPWDAELRRNGMDYAHVFNWEKTARDVLNVYRSTS